MPDLSQLCLLDWKRHCSLYAEDKRLQQSNCVSTSQAQNMILIIIISQL